ncbi:hypothetical protein OG225_11295 [Nocardia sp. NBC_01377]
MLTAHMSSSPRECARRCAHATRSRVFAGSPHLHIGAVRTHRCRDNGHGLTAAAAAALQVAPAAPAYAQSPICAKAVDLINAAVDISGGNLDDATAHSLSDRLSGLAVLAGGEEQAAIVGYANALVDDNITDLDPATDEPNRVCGAAS